MLVVALIAAWVVVACALAVFAGRALAVSEKSDRWRHGHREVRDPRRLQTVPPASPLVPAPEQDRPAA